MNVPSIVCERDGLIVLASRFVLLGSRVLHWNIRRTCGRRRKIKAYWVIIAARTWNKYSYVWHGHRVCHFDYRCSFLPMLCGYLACTPEKLQGSVAEPLHIDTTMLLRVCDDRSREKPQQGGGSDVAVQTKIIGKSESGYLKTLDKWRVEGLDTSCGISNNIGSQCDDHMRAGTGQRR